MLTGKTLNAKKAKKSGLVDMVVDSLGNVAIQTFKFCMLKKPIYFVASFVSIKEIVKNSSEKFVKKLSKNSSKNSSKNHCHRCTRNLKKPQGHQSNNEFYVIYKSAPFMAESRFLEAPLVRQVDGELNK